MAGIQRPSPFFATALVQILESLLPGGILFTSIHVQSLVTKGCDSCNAAIWQSTIIPQEERGHASSPQKGLCGMGVTYVLCH